MVRQIFKKCHEYNIELHNIFIDYSQAFDSINRNKITECLIKYEVPTKLIKLIGLTLTSTIAKLKIGNQFTNEFRIVTGVKQGDPLSATLFSIVIDHILKQLDLRGNITTRIKQCSAYGEDILLTTRMMHALEDTFKKLKEISIHVGLTINEHKTGNNSIEEEIKRRISLGNKAFYANQDLLKSKLLSKNSKLRMYKTLVRPVATYACETWVLKENIKTKLKVFERTVLRRIYGPTKQKDGTWRIKTNEELNRLTDNKNIINYIKAQRLAWFGHVHHMPDTSMVKKVYEWSPAQTRSLGRPKN